MLQTQDNTEIYKLLMIGAEEIGRLAEKEAMKADTNNTVSQAVIDKIKEVGIHKLLLPKEYGYPQIAFKTLGDIVAKVGYYNLSAAWLTYFYSLHNAWVMYLPKHRRDEIYLADSLLADIFSPVGQVEEVEGGFILNGMWHYVSGVKYSDWVGVCAAYKPEGAEKPVMLGLALKRDQFEIIENWNSIGLRGSGSNSIRVKNVFVPKDLTFYHGIQLKDAVHENEKFDSEYLFSKTHFIPAFFSGFAAMSLGAAERIIDEFYEGTSNRIRTNGIIEQESPRSQRVMAELTLKLKTAKLLFQEYLQKLEEDGGECTCDPSEYKVLRAKIIRLCNEISFEALLTYGAKGLAKGHAMEIMLRDLLAIGAHVTSLYEDAVAAYGKNLFGFSSEVIG